MPLLLIDTAFDTCQVGLAQGGKLIAELRAPSGGGHDRVLAGMVRDILSTREDGKEYSRNAIKSLSQIVVTTGPGRFTGLRVGIAFARGLALVHQTSVTGALSTDALAVEMDWYHPAQQGRAILVCIKRGESFIRFLDNGATLHVVPDDILAAVLKEKKITLVGGVLSPFALETVQNHVIPIADQVAEPSLAAILAAAPDQQTGIVRPYYAASYAA